MSTPRSRRNLLTWVVSGAVVAGLLWLPLSPATARSSRSKNWKNSTTTTTVAPATTTTTVAPATTNTTVAPATTNTTVAPATTTTTAPSTATASGSGRSWFVSPGGTGDCSAAKPCGSIATAYGKAAAGDEIVLANGNYPGQTVPPRSDAATWTKNVVVRPASVGGVSVAALTLQAKRLTIRDLVVNGNVLTDRSMTADYLRLERLRVVNGSVFLTNADHSALVGSEITGGVNKDGINVKGGSDDVLIAGNYVHHMRHDASQPNATTHVDCMQLFLATNVTIRDNRFVRCSRSALIVQDEAAGPTRGIRVMNNVVQHCTTATLAGCENQETALWARSQYGNGSDYTIVNNVIDGFALVDPVPGLTFKNNVLRRFFHTDNTKLICNRGLESNNLVQQGGSCSSLAPSDRMGWPAFDSLDRDGSPRVSGANSIPLGFGETAAAPPNDFFGNPRCPAIEVGAHETSC